MQQVDQAHISLEALLPDGKELIGVSGQSIRRNGYNPAIPEL